MAAAGWEPATESELRTAIADGNLAENRHLDAKREVGSTDSARRELARDLASFAIDGGALLVGVGEDEAEWQLTPFVLAGQAERVEQVAANRVDPPLFVTVRDIPADASDGTGYLWVEVPPSPQAPHMVDAVYWGRLDRTKGKLTDADVVRLHSRRKSLDDVTLRLLDDEMTRDPVLKRARTTGHLYLVAWPISGRRDLALALTRDPDRQVFFDVLGAAEPELTPRVREFAPGPSYANRLARRAQGVASTTLGGSTGKRTIEEGTSEERMLDVEWREDGGIRVVMGRMVAPYGGSSDSPHAIADGLAVAYARRVIRWAERISVLCGYGGGWGFGVAADLMQHSASTVYLGERGWGATPTPYDDSEYREVTTASGLEMRDQPWQVADRLVGRLLCGLGTDHHYSADLLPPAEAAD